MECNRTCRIALRLSVRLVTGAEDYWTHGYDFYAVLARSLADGYGYAFPGEPPTAFRVPFYPLFIALVSDGARNVWGLIAAQALVSSGTAVLAGLIAGGWTTRRRLLAAGLYAAWPYAVWHDVSLQESGLFAFLAALATWLLLRLAERRGAWLALAAGGAMGLALLTRTTLLPFAGLAIVWLVLSGARHHRLLRRIAGVALVVAGMALVLSPWVMRNYRLTGDVQLTSETGAMMFIGNHPLTFSVYPQGSIDRSRDRIFAAEGPGEQATQLRLGADPVALDGWYRSRALAYIAADPGAFVNRAVQKLWAAFGPLPSPRHGTIANLGYAAGWVPFFGLALAGMWRRRRQWAGDILLYLHFATFAAATALFWAHTAHRSYLDPYLAVFAAMALAALLPARAKAALDSD